MPITIGGGPEGPQPPEATGDQIPIIVNRPDAVEQAAPARSVDGLRVETSAGSDESGPFPVGAASAEPASGVDTVRTGIAGAETQTTADGVVTEPSVVTADRPDAQAANAIAGVGTADGSTNLTGAADLERILNAVPPADATVIGPEGVEPPAPAPAEEPKPASAVPEPTATGEFQPVPVVTYPEAGRPLPPPELSDKSTLTSFSAQPAEPSRARAMVQEGAARRDQVDQKSAESLVGGQTEITPRPEIDNPDQYTQAFLDVKPDSVAKELASHVLMAQAQVRGFIDQGRPMAIVAQFVSDARLLLDLPEASGGAGEAQ